MKLRYASILALSAAVSAQADTYRVELNAGFGQGSADEGPADIDYDVTAANATVYFSDVSTTKGPLSEAAFLDKASGLGATYSKLAFDGSFDASNLVIDGRFVLANDFIIEASATRDEVEIDGYEADADSFSVGLGTYLNNNSDIVATFSSSDDTETDSLGIDYHTVVAANGDSAWGVDLGASYIDAADETGHGLTVGATYYPNDNFGIGANVNQTSVGDFDTTTVTAQAEYFFNTNFAGAILYSVSEEDDADLNQWMVGLTARF